MRFAEFANGNATAAALRAMQARGIKNATELLAYAEPDAILETCNWFDTLKDVGPGLLAKKIREGGVNPADMKAAQDAVVRRQAERRAQFAEYADRFPEGSVIETHRRLSGRPSAIYEPTPINDKLDRSVGNRRPARWFEEQKCVGSMVVIAVEYPLIEVRCDACGYEAAYPWKARTEMPAAPAATGRPEPLPHQANPEARTPTTEELPRHPKFKGLEETVAAASSWLDAWKPKRPEAPPQ